MAESAARVWIKGALTLATVGVVGFVAYEIYKKYASGKTRMLPPAATTKDTTSDAPEVVALELPYVDKGENLSTKTQWIITTKNPSYRYVAIQRQYEADGATVYDFKSPIDGYFTDKLLSLNGKLYAEIRPT